VRHAGTRCVSASHPHVGHGSVWQMSPQQQYSLEALSQLPPQPSSVYHPPPSVRIFIASSNVALESTTTDLTRFRRRESARSTAERRGNGKTPGYNGPRRT